MVKVVQNEDFLVREQGSSIWNGNTVQTHLWFEVLEGEDQGIRVSIPLHSQEYSSNFQESIQGLQEGDVVEASMKRDSESGSWIPTEIDKKYNINS